MTRLPLPETGCNLAALTRAFHKRTHAGLAPPVRGAGVVTSNGATRVTLLLTDGSSVTYRAAPKLPWRFQRERLSSHLRVVAPAPTPGSRVKAAIDLALPELADIERRAREAQSQPESIAAE